MVTRGRLLRVLQAVAILLGSTACSSDPSPRPAPSPTGAAIAGPTPAPSTSPAGSAGPSPVVSRGPGRLGVDWAQAGFVEPPEGDPTATTPPYVNPGSLGHPQAYQGGEADMLDVAALGNRLVAAGYLAGDFRAAAWWSSDGRAWALADVPAEDGSSANAVAIGPRTSVAVGGEGLDAAVWLSTDGRAWRRIRSPSFQAEPQVRMTAVVAMGDGFVAGGYVGSLAGGITAAAWTSPDGETWERAAANPAFDGARITGLAIAAGGSPMVAVGITGDSQDATGGIAWRSKDGRTWDRAAAEDFADGLLNAVARSPDGWLAVGSNLGSSRARAWRSTDGGNWTALPSSPALENFGLKIEMRDVAWVGDRYLAGGHYLFGTQYPAGALWTSPDGETWTRAPEAIDLSQGKVQGVVAGPDGFVAVGSYGSPDISIPRVWLSPPG